MRDKKLICSLLFSAVLVVFFTCSAFASAPPNWGDVNGTIDIVPLTLFGDSYYSPNEAETELEFTVVGGSYPDPGYVTWSSPDHSGYTFDVIIIRTTDLTGDLDGTAWYSGGDEIDLVFVKDEETLGDFSASFDVPIFQGLYNGQSCDSSFSWDFTQEEGRLMTGVLHAPRYDFPPVLTGDTANCDIGVVLLEETPTFDIFVGKSGEEMQYARSLGPVISTDCSVDAGLVFLRSDDSLGIIYANFWNEQITLSSTETGFSPMRLLFAPDLYGGDGPPAMVDQLSNYVIDPALALEGYISSIGSREDSFTHITFADGTVTHLSWLWCELIAQDEHSANAVGFAGNPTSADFNDELDDKIFKVLVSEDFFPSSVLPEEFDLVTTASSGDFIGQVSMDISIPFQADVMQKWAIPIGLRIGIPGENIEQYDPDLMQTVEAELGENPTEEELEAAVRKYLSFTKEWSTGETAQIRLDDPEFADAVDIYFEMDGEGDVNNIIFEFTLLIVNGGEAGVIDSATANGRKYIVIYDGNPDLSFSDPIKLAAAYEEDTSGSGGSGCSASGFVPAAGLLLLPLLMLLKK